MLLSAITLVSFIKLTISDSYQHYNYPQHRSQQQWGYHNQRHSISSSSSHNYHHSPQIRRQINIPQSHNRHHKQLSYGNYNRKPILIQPGHSQRTQKNIVNTWRLPPHYRSSRKIPSHSKHNKLTKSYHKKPTGYVKHDKSDNLGIESFVVNTKVKVPVSKSHSPAGHNAKPQAVKSHQTQKRVKPVVAEVPVKRNYNGASISQPRFIIQQAGSAVIKVNYNLQLITFHFPNIAPLDHIQRNATSN